MPQSSVVIGFYDFALTFKTVIAFRIYIAYGKKINFERDWNIYFQTDCNPQAANINRLLQRAMGKNTQY